MSQRKTELTPFTLKLSEEERKSLKVICAIDETIRYQYQVIDEAVFWAVKNHASLVAIANPRLGGSHSYYASKSIDQIRFLEQAWNCTPTRALYTAVVGYLKYRSVCVDALQAIQASG